MDSLIMVATQDSPGINFDIDNNKFLIFGKSYPEEAKKYFEPIIFWLEEYVNNPNEETKFEFRLEYYNSSTSTMLLEILYILENILKNGKKVIVHWNYLEVDDDMLDAGKEYEEMVNIPFEFNAIEDY